ncbi:MAG TPA: hypothetical protein VHS13_09395 [Edaphobacter sp.]|jgi:hypothetical protein|nr:hypothetical protein [Edaphobacter sp.]
MFELLTGNGINELAKVKPLLEGITVLFHFRNVLGHGREVSATRFHSQISSQSEEFNGTYRKVEDYLLKTKLLKHRFVDVHSEYLFLGSEIADHFWNLVKQVPQAVVDSLSAPEAEVCSKVLEEQRSAGARTS